jgi:hypothetical protein
MLVTIFTGVLEVGGIVLASVGVTFKLPASVGLDGAGIEGAGWDPLYNEEVSPAGAGVGAGEGFQVLGSYHLTLIFLPNSFFVKHLILEKYLNFKYLSIRRRNNKDGRKHTTIYMEF